MVLFHGPRGCGVAGNFGGWRVAKGGGTDGGAVGEGVSAEAGVYGFEDGYLLLLAFLTAKGMFSGDPA